MQLRFKIHGICVEVTLGKRATSLAEHLRADFGIFETDLFDTPPALQFVFEALEDEVNSLIGENTIGIRCDIAQAGKNAWLRMIRPQFTPRITERLLQKGNTILFHASAAANSRGAVAFLGEKGAGKSSLCYLLVKNDFQYLSNDLMYLQLSDGATWCLGLPQELTLGESAMTWFNRSANRMGSDLASTLKRKHGTDHATKTVLRHPAGLMVPRAPLRALVFPEPALDLREPRARRLTDGETAQKLVVNTQTCVRWDFSPQITADAYLQALTTVVEGTVSLRSLKSYLFQWTWDHNKNVKLIREILGD